MAFVHSMWLPMTIRAVWMVKRAGVKLVRMPHECKDPKKVRGGWWKKLPVLLTLARKALKAADLIYVTCDAEAKWMRPWVGKIVNVPLGVDFGEEGRGERLRLTADVLRVLFIGRMHPLKGLDVLLEAVANRENVELTVVGLDEKGMRARFEAWCAAKGIASRIRFLGVVDEATKIAAGTWTAISRRVISAASQYWLTHSTSSARATSSRFGDSSLGNSPHSDARLYL